MKRLILFCGLVLSLLSFAHAQRPVDVFSKSRVLVRLDLQQKMNQGLDRPVESGTGQESEGIVRELVEAFEAGTLTGYVPDKPQKVLSYEDFVKQLITYLPVGESYPSGYFTRCDSCRTSEDYGDDLGTLLLPLRSVIEMVEDRVIDKVHSAQSFQIQWIRLVAIDPNGRVPDKVIAMFKYSEATPVLQQTYDYNRHNEAEYRTVWESLQLRKFTSFIVNVSGTAAETMLDSAQKEQKLISREHEMWQP